MKDTTYRDVLRTDTHTHHERVDEAFSTLDLTTRDGLGLFLRTHRVCFAAMKSRALPQSVAYVALHDMVTRIDRDLMTLRAAPCDAALPRIGPVDPLALDYMIEGSRLGSRILQKRWLAADDTTVRSAGAYFSLEPTSGRWRQVCEAIAEVPKHSTRATKITRDTQLMFDMFLQVAKEQGRVTAPSLEVIQ